MPNLIQYRTIKFIAVFSKIVSSKRALITKQIGRWKSDLELRTVLDYDPKNVKTSLLSDSKYWQTPYCSWGEKVLLRLVCVSGILITSRGPLCARHHFYFCYKSVNNEILYKFNWCKEKEKAIWRKTENTPKRYQLGHSFSNACSSQYVYHHISRFVVCFLIMLVSLFPCLSFKTFPLFYIFYAVFVPREHANSHMKEYLSITRWVKCLVVFSWT